MARKEEYMKKIITLLLILLALFTLTSCDKTTEDVIKVIDVKLTEESNTIEFFEGM